MTNTKTLTRSQTEGSDLVFTAGAAYVWTARRQAVLEAATELDETAYDDLAADLEEWLDGRGRQIGRYDDLLGSAFEELDRISAAYEPLDPRINRERRGLDEILRRYDLPELS
jgi:hypothetical protein